MKIVELNDIEALLDLTDPEISQMYRSWDMGDCSLVGLIEILLCQTIKNHKQENGAYYDSDYDQIHLRYTLAEAPSESGDSKRKYRVKHFCGGCGVVSDKEVELDGELKTIIAFAPGVCPNCLMPTAVTADPLGITEYWRWVRTLG
jgi:hypothetical protein